MSTLQSSLKKSGLSGSEWKALISVNNGTRTTWDKTLLSANERILSYKSFSTSVRPSVCLSVCLSDCLCICLSVFSPLPKLFSNYFQYASNVHKYNTRYASKQNLFVKKVRTNTKKTNRRIGYPACIIWNKVPWSLKELNIHQFSKQLKPYLLSE